jgi:hypothetical protein
MAGRTRARVSRLTTPTLPVRSGGYTWEADLRVSWANSFRATEYQIAVESQIMRE